MGIVDRDVPADGRWHPTDIDGDPRGRGDGRIKLFPDGEGGIVCNWKGETLPFFVDDGRKLKEDERRDRERKRAESIRLAREEESRRHAEAREKAAAILEGATGDPAAHPYAVKKRVPLGPLVKRGAWPQRGWTDALLVPIYGGADGRVCSIEAIDADGDKDFLAGGKFGGGFHPFGKVRGADRVLIGEGLATVAACVAAESPAAVAALSASNLKAVALAVRELAPGAEIILLADNDVKPDGNNPGLKASEEAAAAVGGRVAVPDLGGRKCDFWDLWQELGDEAVRRAIAGAEAPYIEGTSAHATDAADDVRDPLDSLVEKTAADPGAPFAPDAVERLATLKKDDRARFEALRAKLKKAGCRVTALDEAIAEENGDMGAARRRRTFWSIWPSRPRCSTPRTGLASPILTSNIIARLGRSGRKAFGSG